MDRGRVGHGLYRAVGVGVDDLSDVGGADGAGQADVRDGVEVARVGLADLVHQDVVGHAFGRGGVGGGDVERRFVAVVGRVGGVRVVFVDDGAAGTGRTDIGTFWSADGCTKVFTFFIDRVVYRNNSDCRHICRSSTQWDRNSDSCQGFSQAYRMCNTRSIGICDTLNIIRFKLTQIEFEYNGTVLCTYRCLGDMEYHAGGFAFNRDRRICRDIDYWFRCHLDI